jgi:hypothetical protein
MPAVRIFSAWQIAALLAFTAPGLQLGTPDPIPAPLAHSALLTLEGAAAPGVLVLRVRSNTAGTALNVSDFQVSLDGRVLPVSARADGAWRAALPAEAAAGAGQLEVRVAHDGVSEILDARIKLPAAAQAAPSGVLAGAHKQIIWWILNIGIVLIAALVISRRTS